MLKRSDRRYTVLNSFESGNMSTCLNMGMLRDWRASTRDSFPKMLAELACPHSVINASEDNIHGEFRGEMRLNWVLLLFPSHITRRKSVYIIFWWNLGTTHYASVTANLLAKG